MPTEDLGFIGTLPQWGMFITLLSTLAVFFNRRKEITVGEAAALRKEMAEQSRECEETKRILNRRIDDLLSELHGEKSQRIAEQISLIGLIMKSAPDSAEFQGMLRILETVQDQLEREAPKRMLRRVSLEDSRSTEPPK